MPTRFTALLFSAVLPLSLAAGPTDSVTPPDSPAVQVDVVSETPASVRIRVAIDSILEETDLPPAHWGIYVRDIANGETVYARNADRLFLPASNLKLVTTALALDVFGPAHRFATRLYFDGETLPNGTLRGDIVVRGSGDPTFGSRASGDEPFDAWAASLAEAGVTAIEGRIIGDDDAVEDAPWAEGWDVSHVGVEQYAQAVGGLSWNDNLVGVRVRGGSVETSPEGFVSVERLDQAGAAVWRRLGTNVIVVRGRPQNASVLIPIEQPTLFALHGLRRALADAGIRVDAELVDVDDLSDPLDYAGLGAPVLAHLSPPLAEIIAHTNRRSDNFYAEQLFRVTSANGTATAASARALGFLEDAGAPIEGLSIRDGSGLSRKDMITPRAFVQLLIHMDRHEHRDVFLASLPAGGDGRSTLGRRLTDVQVQAKTGSIEYVRALSGYVRGPDGRRLAFSVIANNYTTRAGRIVDAVDRVVRAIATGARVPSEE
jgi:D-alanyl-D-alanine carboxypeptidase/D-alanyl-D-alanine-endopeptidase (penicillin-binding protein 4)